LRDDDLSIPVLADVLEPGDPAKADPAVPRRPMDHAWTDALVREARAEPLAAVPMLSEVLVPGDPARAHHSPQPAGSGLTIPLLTDVLIDHERVSALAHEEMPGAPIPLLTDVIADFDDPVVADEVHPDAVARDNADVASHSVDAFAFEVDDLPVLTDVFVDEAEPVPAPAVTAPVSQHTELDWDDAPADVLADESASAQRATALSALASSIEANLLDSELPFRAYCAFPGELASTPIDVGGSAMPPVYPMAKVPLPFGSGELDAPSQDSTAHESTAQEGTVRETFTHDPTPLRAVIAPESSDAAAVSTYPVPFEPIATEPLPEAMQADAAQSEATEQEPAHQETVEHEVFEPASLQPGVFESEFVQPEVVQPEVVHSDVVKSEEEEPALAMAVDEADHLAAMLSRPEPVAAELTKPQPEYLSELALVPAQVEIDHVAADVRARALRYLAGEGHALIESRCQEQAVWLAHRITREIATTLEREIGQWVQEALNDALEKRLPPR
jgi:hypothetical protein